MQAVVMYVTGNADVLRLEETDRPEPDEGEVLIRVRAAAVNPVDWKYRRGLVERQLPAVLGEDISGTVEVSRTDDFAPGDEVFGIASSGGHAEYATAAATALAIKPAELSYEHAAALPAPQ
jgi:NADPH:quinone reductase-like Zn-dependent oxidoreductase